MLGVRRWVERTAAGLVSLLVLCALPGCQIIAGDECKDASRLIADGQSSHGVTPSDVVAPLIGEHAATLTWSLTGTVMPAHVDIERAMLQIVASQDCNGIDDGFSVPVNITIASNDRVIVWALELQALVVTLDGKVQDQAIDFSASIEAPEIEDPATPLGVVAVSLRIQNGSLVSTPILLYEHSVARQPIGSLQF
jgi:hypothetical protein